MTVGRRGGLRVGRAPPWTASITKSARRSTHGPRQTAIAIFDRQELLNRLAGPAVADVRCYESIGSTNTAALEAAKTDLPAGGVLFVAERQTAGRGQRGNSWWSSEGSLAFSLLTRPLRLAGENLPTAGVAVGAAICQAISATCPEAQPELKWPNDIYLESANGGREKKLGGVLIEAPAAGPGRLVAGVGINANNRLADAPAEVFDRATSLIDATGRPTSLADLLVGCVEQIVEALDRLATGDATLHHDWRQRSLLEGRRASVQTPGGLVEGECGSIDELGRLEIRTPSGTQRISSGTVIDWR